MGVREPVLKPQSRWEDLYPANRGRAETRNGIGKSDHPES